MHNFILNQGLKAVKDLDKILDCLFFRNVFFFLQVSSQISFIAILQNKVNVINSLLDINQSNDVVVSTRFKHLNLVIEKFCKLALD